MNAYYFSLKNSRLNIYIRSFLSVSCLYLSGCAGLSKNPDFLSSDTSTSTSVLHNKSEAQIPTNWSNEKANLNTEKFENLSRKDKAIIVNSDYYWWHEFNDPQLNQLIDKIFTNNNSLKRERLKIALASLTASMAANPFKASINAQAKKEALKNLSTGDTSDSTKYSIFGQLSYDVDLFGKNARIQDSYNWALRSVKFEAQSVALNTISLAANIYWNIGYINQRINFAQIDLSDADKLLSFAKVKFEVGIITKTDLHLAEKNFIERQLALNEYIKQRDNFRNALAILFDQPPGQHESFELIGLDRYSPKEVVLSTPIEVLSKRPDMQVISAMVQKELAAFDAQKLAIYPNLNLQLNLQSGSNTIADILKNPIAAMVGNLVWPLLDWNGRKLGIKSAELRYKQVIIEYRDVLYKALSDVEDTVAERDKYAQEQSSKQRILEIVTKVTELTKVQYDAGKIKMQDLLDRQSVQRSAEISVAENKLFALRNAMKLRIALGAKVAL